MNEVTIEQPTCTRSTDPVETAVGKAQFRALSSVDDGFVVVYLNSLFGTAAPLQGYLMGRHLLPDVASTVATGPTNLVSARRAAGRSTEVDEEVLIEFHSAFFGIDISFHH